MRPAQRRRPRSFLERLPLRERTTVLDVLRNETTGGLLMLVAAIAAVTWANSPWRDSYEAIRATTFGPAALRLDLDVQHWAADGLLAVFFLVAGLELKRELVLGELRTPARALLPMCAAVAGMVAPALLYIGVNLAGDGSLSGWAVPTATDIAFALAVLAVLGSSLPTAMRAFLLTLAVVDDLLAIVIIAVFFTADLELLALLGAAAGLVLYAVLQKRRVRAWWVYVPLGLTVWTLMHASGVHATVAGVAMGLLTRVRRDRGEHHSPAENLEHRVHPFSAGIAVPVFALFAAGVTIDSQALRALFTEPVPLGVTLGLVVGKTVGVLGGAWAATRLTRAELNPDLSWWDVLGLAMLAGIGFTVSLLIGELAFPAGDERDLVKAAVLTGSVIAALLAAVVLRVRHAAYRRIELEDSVDVNHDGIPDVYQPGLQTLPPGRDGALGKD